MDAIIVEHLSKRVRDADGWLTILDDLSFRVPAGQTVVLRLSRDVRRRPEFLCGLDDGAVLAGALPGP